MKSTRLFKSPNALCREYFVYHLKYSIGIPISIASIIFPSFASIQKNEPCPNSFKQDANFPLLICFLSLDFIDIVKEQTYSADYYKDEDPKLFISEKTGRGPLADNWLIDYWNEVKHCCKKMEIFKFIFICEIVDYYFYPPKGQRKNSANIKKYVPHVCI